MNRYKVECPWSDLKAFASRYGAKIIGAQIGSLYYVVANYGIFEASTILKITSPANSDQADFETNYKGKVKPEALRSRNTNCREGAKLQCRYISLKTSDLGNFDNTDFKDRDFADVTYTMKKKESGVWTTTTNNTEADETWIDFEPAYDYEIRGGEINVPETLAGDPSEEAMHELHVVAVPDIPAPSGEIIFVANPKLMFDKGEKILIDCADNPSFLQYNSTYHTNKIRFIFKHPRGAQSLFRIALAFFK